MMASMIYGQSPKTLLKDLQTDYIPKILEKLKKLELTTTASAKGVTVSNIKVYNPTLNIKNFEVTQSGGIISVIGYQVPTSATFDVASDNFLFTGKGTGTVQGNVQKIHFHMDCSQFLSLLIKKPKIKINFIDFKFNPDYTDIKLDVPGISGFLVKVFLSGVKSKICDTMSTLAMNFAQTFTQNLVDQIQSDLILQKSKQTTQ